MTNADRTISPWIQQRFGGPAHLLVVGGGLVGLFTALFHQRRWPSHRVLVVERGAFPDGASVRNAGFACFGSPSEILSDMDQEGPDTALTRVEERWRGLQELRAELGDEAIAFEPTGGYELFHAGSELYTRTADRFDELNRALRDIVGGTAYSWCDERIGDLGLTTGHLACCPWEGPLHSGRLMGTLLRKVQDAGVEVRFGCEVTDLSGSAFGRIRTQDGTTLTAERIVVATNGYIRQLLPQADVLPARGQVVLTQEIPGLRLKGTFHAEEGYFYFRDFQGRVLLGGGRHLDKAGETTWVDGTSALIQQELEQLLRTTILPGTEVRIEQRWSGVMGFRTAGKSPWIERLDPRTVVAAGLSGMGVAIGIRVARQAAQLAWD